MWRGLLSLRSANNRDLRVAGLNSPPNAQTVLVTGIHLEELEFGDAVAEVLDADTIDILRIPHGVSQQCPDVDHQFHYETRQRELYLQLHQQVKRRYQLLIDLHSGLDENGPCADIYCQDPNILECMNVYLHAQGLSNSVRVIRIIGGQGAHGTTPIVDGEARTSIPASIWTSARPIYIGLEIYLPGTADLSKAKDLAKNLIGQIQICGAMIKTPA